MDRSALRENGAMKRATKAKRIKCFMLQYKKSPGMNPGLKSKYPVLNLLRTCPYPYHHHSRGPSGGDGVAPHQSCK